MALISSKRLAATLAHQVRRTNRAQPELRTFEKVCQAPSHQHVMWLSCLARSQCCLCWHAGSFSASGVAVCRVWPCAHCLGQGADALNDVVMGTHLRVQRPMPAACLPAGASELLGLECAGVVTDVGKGVTKFKKGDRVRESAWQAS